MKSPLRRCAASPQEGTSTSTGEAGSSSTLDGHWVGVGLHVKGVT